MNDVCLLFDDLPPSFKYLWLWKINYFVDLFCQIRQIYFFSFFYPLIFRNGEKNWQRTARSGSGTRKRRKGTKEKYGRLLTDTLNCRNPVLDCPSLDIFVCLFLI